MQAPNKINRADVLANGDTLNNSHENNRLRGEDRTAHEWYRFVLSFPPHLVRDCIDWFGANSDTRVLDPFCGTGTTLVECKKLGIGSVGIEPSPMLHFASSVKADWSVDPDGLLAHARQVADLTLSKLEAQGIWGLEELPLFRLPGASVVTLRTLSDDVQKLLLKNSISPLPLHKTLVLLDSLKDQADDRFSQHEKLALAKALTSGISNLHFGPEVGVGPAKKDAPVVEEWLDGIKVMANHLRELQGQSDTQVVVHRADSRCLAGVLEPDSVDVVITSPPYPNEKDYTRITRLESVLLGFISDKQALRSLKEDMIRSNTRGVYKSDRDDQLVQVGLNNLTVHATSTFPW